MTVIILSQQGLVVKQRWSAWNTFALGICILRWFEGSVALPNQRTKMGFKMHAAINVVEFGLQQKLEGISLDALLKVQSIPNKRIQDYNVYLRLCLCGRVLKALSLWRAPWNNMESHTRRANLGGPPYSSETLTRMCWRWLNNSFNTCHIALKLSHVSWCRRHFGCTVSLSFSEWLNCWYLTGSLKMRGICRNCKQGRQGRYEHVFLKQPDSLYTTLITQVRDTSYPTSILGSPHCLWSII